jgi:hypothetical protein
LKGRKMKQKFMMFVVSGLMSVLILSSNNVSAANPENDTDKLYPWCNQYCMSIFTKIRTSKTVGKDHMSVALKVQHFNWTQIRGSSGGYHGRTSGQEKQRLAATLCTKYGWAKDHHIAIGVPYWFNDFDTSTPNDSAGLANVFVFEKWNCIKETNNCPGVAVDFWYYFPTGEAERKLGNDNGAYKITTEISKAWEDFSLHFNPGYTWSEDDDAEVGEINAALIIRSYPDFWPAVEYNYLDKEHKGHSHDLIPGFIWKFAKNCSFKVGAVVNVDSTFTDRDRVGIVLKLFKKW